MYRLVQACLTVIWFVCKGWGCSDVDNRDIKNQILDNTV